VVVPVLPHFGTLSVKDEKGKDVPYLFGLAQVQQRREKIDVGGSKELDQFDLAQAYYLRKPGKYTVQGIEPPVSGAFEFEVAADARADDGDPVGRLLPLLRKNWWMTGGLSAGAVRPGSNHAEGNGRLILFDYNPTGYKKDAGLVYLYLTNEKAAEKKDVNSSLPASEYLGQAARWHVYATVTENAQKDWPTAKEDIKRALETEPKK
jgi:hypothetical protein